MKITGTDAWLETLKNMKILDDDIYNIREIQEQLDSIVITPVSDITEFQYSLLASVSPYNSAIISNILEYMVPIDPDHLFEALNKCLIENIPIELYNSLDIEGYHILLNKYHPNKKEAIEKCISVLYIIDKKILIDDFIHQILIDKYWESSLNKEVRKGYISEIEEIRQNKKTREI